MRLQMAQMQTQLVNIAAVGNASHVTIAKLGHEAGHNAETPSFPVASVEEAELMSGKIAADKEFKKNVVRLPPAYVNFI